MKRDWPGRSPWGDSSCSILITWSSIIVTWSSIWAPDHVSAAGSSLRQIAGKSQVMRLVQHSQAAQDAAWERQDAISRDRAGGARDELPPQKTSTCTSRPGGKENGLGSGGVAGAGGSVGGT